MIKFKHKPAVLPRKTTSRSGAAKICKSSAVPRTRVFLVDDHPIVRRGLLMLLNLESDLTVCGEADSAPAALQKILELRPDVAVIDLSLKSGSGLELIKQCRAQGLKLKLLVFTMQNGVTHAERAFRAGADGFVTKGDGPEKTVEAIRLLLLGKQYLGADLTKALMARLLDGRPADQSGIDSLSDRELEVLELIGSGLGSREVADRLRLSLKTIESHRENIKARLGLTRASELVQYAYHWCREKGGGV